MCPVATESPRSSPGSLLPLRMSTGRTWPDPPAMGGVSGGEPELSPDDGDPAAALRALWGKSVLNGHRG